jgi:hypothetical protein
MMFGKLTLEAIPYHEPIIVGTLSVVVLLGACLLGAITKFKKWGWLWREWIHVGRPQAHRRDVPGRASSCCCAASPTPS